MHTKSSECLEEQLDIGTLYIQQHPNMNVAILHCSLFLIPRRRPLYNSMELDNTPSAASETNDSDNLFGQSPPEASRQPSPEPQEEAPAPVNDAAPAESSSAAYAERQRIKSQAVYNQIHKLNGTDIKLSKLLQIASEAMEAVHPTHREPGGDPASMWSHETTSQQAKDKADEYYALLNVTHSHAFPSLMTLYAKALPRIPGDSN